MGLIRIICGFALIVGALLNIAFIAQINVAGQCAIIFVGCLLAMWGYDHRRYQQFFDEHDRDRQ